MPRMHSRDKNLDKEWQMKKTITAVALSAAISTASAGDVRQMVIEEAVRQGVPVQLALTVAEKESRFKCGAIGRHGERGVMQIKPRTARGLGYRGSPSGLNNCRTGIRYGMMYLRQAHKRADGNVYRTALYYNAGLGTNRKRSAYAEKIVAECGCGRGHKKVYRR